MFTNCSNAIRNNTREPFKCARQHPMHVGSSMPLHIPYTQGARSGTRSGARGMRRRMRRAQAQAQAQAHPHEHVNANAHSHMPAAHVRKDVSTLSIRCTNQAPSRLADDVREEAHEDWKQLRRHSKPSQRGHLCRHMGHCHFVANNTARSFYVTKIFGGILSLRVVPPCANKGVPPHANEKVTGVKATRILALIGVVFFACVHWARSSRPSPTAR